MNIEKIEESIEYLSEKVHDAWQEEKVSQGFHSPNDCQSIHHKSFIDGDDKAKERFEEFHDPKFYKWCDKCHTDLYPYSELEENIKEYDRVTVKTVLNAIKTL